MTPSNLYTDMNDYISTDDLEAYHTSRGHDAEVDDLQRKQAIIALRIAAALVRVHSLTCDDIMKLEGDKQDDD